MWKIRYFISIKEKLFYANKIKKERKTSMYQSLWTVTLERRNNEILDLSFRATAKVRVDEGIELRFGLLP